MKRILIFGVQALFVLLFTVACNNDKNEFLSNVNYLPVQLEKGDFWSIMDADGNIVVEKEYSPDSELTIPYGNGVYWVKTNTKYALYSIDSPQKPISEEYDRVTVFNDGRAFVSISGEPIKMIDTNGKVIKTLDKNIKGAGRFCNERALYATSAGNSAAYGFLDLDGNIATKELYDEAFNFNEGVAIVKKNEDDVKYEVIDKNGGNIGHIDSKKYSLDFLFFLDGKIAVSKNSTQPTLVFLNTKGEEVVGPLEKTKYRESFIDGYAIVRSSDFENIYIIDEEGNNIVRKDKYNSIYHLGNGEFAVEKGDKYGVINSKDDIIVDFNYDMVLGAKLGNNYIMKNDDYYVIVNPQGKEIKNTEFFDIGCSSADEIAVFIDIKTIVDEFLKPISSKGYSTLKGKSTAKEIALLTGANMENFTTYHSSMKGIDFIADGCQVSVKYRFEAPVKKEKTHIEEVNDGWFATKRVVHDGYEWNESSKLSIVQQDMDVPFFSDTEMIRITLKDALEKKGFVYQEDNDEFLSKDGKRLSIECGIGGEGCTVGCYLMI